MISITYHISKQESIRYRRVVFNHSFLGLSEPTLRHIDFSGLKDSLHTLDLAAKSGRSTKIFALGQIAIFSLFSNKHFDNPFWRKITMATVETTQAEDNIPANTTACSEETHRPEEKSSSSRYVIALVMSWWFCALNFQCIHGRKWHISTPSTLQMNRTSAEPIEIVFIPFLGPLPVSKWSYHLAFNMLQQVIE